MNNPVEEAIGGYIAEENEIAKNSCLRRDDVVGAVNTGSDAYDLLPCGGLPTTDQAFVEGLREALIDAHLKPIIDMLVYGESAVHVTEETIMLAEAQAAITYMQQHVRGLDEKWYGYAGHFIGGKNCAYHLSTRIGKHLISTVGHYLPKSSDGVMVPIGAGENANFETYVFDCEGEDESGDPIIPSFTEIDGERYAKSIDAENGHYRYLAKYRALSSLPPVLRGGGNE